MPQDDAKTRSDLVAILSSAIGRIPPAELGDLAHRHHDNRKACQRALAERLEVDLLRHFEIRRRGMPAPARADLQHGYRASQPPLRKP